MSTNGKTLKYRAAKLKGFTVIRCVLLRICLSIYHFLWPHVWVKLVKSGYVVFFSNLAGKTSGKNPHYVSFLPADYLPADFSRYELRKDKI